MVTVNHVAPRGEWSWPNGRAGLLLLLQAHECATATECDTWDFAVEIAELRERGMCDNELRWLLKMKWVEHRIEATLLGHDTRCFLLQGGIKFTPNSCFVFTREGECHVRTLLHPTQGTGAHGLNGNGHALNGHTLVGLPPQGTNGDAVHGHETVAKSLSQREDIESPLLHPQASPSRTTVESQPPVVPKDQRPTWDTDRKELWFGPHLIKRFRFQSPNQETILTVFHEDGWPSKIDDPLPPVPNQTSRQRLHDAIKNLNRHRLSRMIRFAGDGTGEGVRWERDESSGG